MKGIMSGLEPVKMKTGGDPEEKSMMEGIIGLVKEYGPMASLPLFIHRAIQDPEYAERIIKENVFDPEDPLDYATLPLFFAGPLGAGAKRAIKFGRTAQKKARKYKPSGIERAIDQANLNVAGPLAGAGVYLGAGISEGLEEEPMSEEEMMLAQLREELEGYAQGGVVHARFGGPMLKGIGTKIGNIFKRGKKTDTPKTKQKDKDITDKKPDDAPLGDTRPIYRKKRYLIPGTAIGGATALGIYDYIFGDDNNLPEYDIDAAADAANKQGQQGGRKKQLEDDSMRAILLDRATARAKEAGRESPTFIDYVASFPGGYMEKVGKDPEFAKQMMAGFLAMMKPSEGYVPRSGIVDFGEAAMAEAQRQEESIPAAIQTLEYIRDNPELQELYKDVLGSKASTAVRGIDLFGDGASMQTIYSTVYQQKGGKGSDPKLYDSTGKIVTEVELANKAATMDSDTFIEYLQTVGIKNE